MRETSIRPRARICARRGLSGVPAATAHKLVHLLVKAGLLKSVRGQGGGVQLKEDAVGYTLDGSLIEVPEEVIADVEAIREQAINGDFVIPESIDDVATFVAENSYKK